MKISQKAKAFRTVKQAMTGLGLIGLLFYSLVLFLNYLQS
jgi:hypothetical protein